MTETKFQHVEVRDWKFSGKRRHKGKFNINIPYKYTLNKCNEQSTHVIYITSFYLTNMPYEYPMYKISISIQSEYSTYKYSI